jgi:hypothetical protein
MSKEAPNGSGSIVGFSIATLCALPFAVELGLYGAYLLTHKDWMVNWVVLSRIFAWPVLAIFALAGLVSICSSWVPSSRIRKVLLFLYALIIVGFAAFWYSLMTNIGP